MLPLESYLDETVQHIRNLCACSDACILLGCPTSDLGHPLLKQVLAAQYLATTNSIIPLPDHETVAALCDIALQTGSNWHIEDMPLLDGSAGCLLAFPLAQPTGSLGLLLLATRQPGCLAANTFHLLQAYLSLLSQDLEEFLASLWQQFRREQAAARQLAPREFVSLVSHELRVPLAAIKGYTGLLQAYAYPATEEQKEQAMSPERRQRYLDAIMEQANHLEMLVSDLLDISRIQTGQLALHPTPVDIGPICQRVIEQVESLVEQQQPGLYHLSYTASSPLPLSWADPARVQQILTNIVENAVKYSPNGGTIEIRAHPLQTPLSPSLAPQNPQSQSYTCITVRDWGIGIPDKHLSAIFKPFFRLHHPGTSHVPGNGLGLYISRTLAMAMGGQLMITSNEGQGTCVSFLLPAVPASTFGPLSPTQRAATSSLKKQGVLNFH